LRSMAVHPVDDHSYRFFIWHEWIQAHGPLTTENVFDYFATSMFYDKQSNNQVLRMQTMHTGASIANEAEELRRFTGVEFAVVQAQPPSLFIIHKRDRLSPDEVRPLAAYFVLNNRIYQSPDVYAVLSNRLLTTLHSLQESLQVVRAHRPDFAPRLGFSWPVVDSNKPLSSSLDRRDDGRGRASTEPDGMAGTEFTDEAGARAIADRRSAAAPETSPAQGSKLMNTHPLLMAMNTTAIHSRSTFASRLMTQDVSLEPASAGPIVESTSLPTPTAPRQANTAKQAALEARPPTKGPPGGGKKKRRRTAHLAAQTA